MIFSSDQFLQVIVTLHSLSDKSPSGGERFRDLLQRVFRRISRTLPSPEVFFEQPLGLPHLLPLGRGHRQGRSDPQEVNHVKIIF